MSVERRLDVLEARGPSMSTRRAHSSPTGSASPSPPSSSSASRTGRRATPSSSRRRCALDRRDVRLDARSSTPTLWSEWGCPRASREAVLRRVATFPRRRGGAHGRASVIGRDFRLEIDSPALGRHARRVVCPRSRRSSWRAPPRGPRRGDILAFSTTSCARSSTAAQRSRGVRLHHRVAEALELRSRKAVNPPSSPSTSSSRVTSPGRCRPAATRSKRLARRHRALAYEEAVRHFVDALALFEAGDAPACDVLLLLAAWAEGCDGGRRATARDAFLDAFVAAAERGRRRAPARSGGLGVGERYCEMPYWDAKHLDLLEKALVALGTAAGTAACQAALAAGGEPRLSPRARARARPADEALAMARRLGDEAFCSRSSSPVMSRCSTSPPRRAPRHRASSRASRPVSDMPRSITTGVCTTCSRSVTSTRPGTRRLSSRPWRPGCDSRSTARSPWAAAGSSRSSTAELTVAESCAQECLRHGTARPHAGREEHVGGPGPPPAPAPGAGSRS